MRLYSYVIPRDYGFAPNPFHGVCTLATCMPKIRKYAEIGDWVIGTGSAQYTERNIVGCLVYAMKVSELMSFDGYWLDPRYQSKKPNLRASLKYQMGDNIYHRPGGGENWEQADSHHSCEDGTINIRNVAKDTGTTTNVLIAEKWFVWNTDYLNLMGVNSHIRGRGSTLKRNEKNRAGIVRGSTKIWLSSQKDRILL